MMKKALILPFLVISLCFLSTSHGQAADDSGAYIGIGGIYAIQDFDIDSVRVDGFTYDPEYDDTWGVNAKIGYHINSWFSLEADFDYYSSFELDDTVTIMDVPVNLKSDADIWTIMALGKFASDFGMLKPFLIGGIGMMSAEADVTSIVTVLDTPIPLYLSSDETDMCAKFGLGLDLFATDTVSIGLEGAYVWGFNDLDDIRLFTITLGLAYHFGR